jgi:hypothetical protein
MKNKNENQCFILHLFLFAGRTMEAETTGLPPLTIGSRDKSFNSAFA